MNIVLVICSLATGHALFWASILLTMNKRLSNRLMALILIMLALRVGKSVTGIVLPNHLYFFSTIGAISMAEIGPLLFLFSKSFFDNSFRLKIRDYIHFIPGILLFPALLFTQWSLLNLSYFFFTTHLFLYIVLTETYLFNHRESFKADDLKWRWITFLVIAVSLIWITFVLQLFFYHPVVYKLIVITAAVIFYFLSWWAIPRSKIFLPESKKKGDESHVHEELGKRIKLVLENEELFTDPGLTVTKLASHLKAPAYLVSKAINHFFDKSFSELLTQYRIKKSEQLLFADGNKTLTIEAIAYESGFNTLSAFYSAFKKMNKVTPAQFRDSRNQSNMRIA
jgi:AraC-like DNA-binding protein